MRVRRNPIHLSVCALTLLAVFAPVAHADGTTALIPNLPAVPTLSTSTVPANGDVNPYGVAFVPSAFPGGGTIHSGDILVSNFNNSVNLQGTGTTIVATTPSGATSTFFQGPMGLGLTTALGVLQRGFVLVGNVPTTDGTAATIQQGSLIVLDRNGNAVANWTDSVFLDGPWFLTIDDHGGSATVFVSNVLTGTVTRLEVVVPHNGAPRVVRSTTLATGYLIAPNAAALVVGPTGLAYDSDRDVLYVASTGDNAIYAIEDAERRSGGHGLGKLVYNDNNHLHGPLALLLAPNGDLLIANGDAINPDASQPSEIVEFTRHGRFVAQFSVDSAGEGGAFGIALVTHGDHVTFAAVDDVMNSLDVWSFDLRRGHLRAMQGE